MFFVDVVFMKNCSYLVGLARFYLLYLLSTVELTLMGKLPPNRISLCDRVRKIKYKQQNSF